MAWSEYLLVMRSRLSLQLSTRQQRRLPNIGRARLVLRDAGCAELPSIASIDCSLVRACLVCAWAAESTSCVMSLLRVRLCSTDYVFFVFT